MNEITHYTFYIFSILFWDLILLIIVYSKHDLFPVFDL